MREEVEACVDRGMELLDNTFPGWEAYIDVNSVNIINCYSCILGQLGRKKYRLDSYEAFSGLCTVLGIGENTDMRSHYGFTPFFAGYMANYGLMDERKKLLDEVWKERLTARQTPDKLDEVNEKGFQLVASEAGAELVEV